MPDPRTPGGVPASMEHAEAIRSAMASALPPGVDWLVLYSDGRNVACEGQGFSEAQALDLLRETVAVMERSAPPT